MDQYFGIIENEKVNVYLKPVNYDIYDYLVYIDYQEKLFSLNIEKLLDYVVFIKVVGYENVIKTLSNLKSLNLFDDMFSNKININKVKELKRSEYDKVLSMFINYYNQEHEIGVINKQSQLHNRVKRKVRKIVKYRKEIEELEKKLNDSFNNNLIVIGNVIQQISEIKDNYYICLNQFYDICNEFFNDIDNELVFLKHYNTNPVEDITKFVKNSRYNTINKEIVAYDYEDDDVDFPKKKLKNKVKNRG